MVDHGKTKFHTGTYSDAEHIMVHSSNELYGADRVVLDILSAVPYSLRDRMAVWLPDDLPTGQYRLDQKLEAMGIEWSPRSLPIIRRAHLSLLGFPSLIMRFVQTFMLLRRTRPKTVYCTTAACLLVALIARLIRTPEIVLHAQEIWSGREAKVLALLARNCTRIVAVSEAVARSLPDSIRDRISVIPNSTTRAVETGQLCGESNVRFLIAGRWNQIKGYETLLKAWDTEEPLGHLTVLGGLPPSGKSVDVVSIVKTLRHPNSVSVVGEVPDIRPFINSCDVMVVPSDGEEAFGLVAIEAFAHSRPVIASTSGGLVEVVEDGRTGWIFPRGEWEALRLCLSSVTRTDIIERGSNALEIYEKKFSHEIFISRMRSFWLDLVEAD